MTGFSKRLFLVTMAVLLWVAPARGKAIVCSAGEFIVGYTATVMCYFPDDIVNHGGVYVQYHPYNAATDVSAKEVFVCASEDVKASKCMEQNGYFLRRHTRNTVQIGIPSVTKEAAGQYMCQFIPPDDSPREPCDLIVRDDSTWVRDSDGVSVPMTVITAVTFLIFLVFVWIKNKLN